MIIQGVEIVHFTEEEFTDVHGMHLPLLLELDRLREYIRARITVKESNPARSPHSSHMKDSLHYAGRATDIAANDKSLWDLFLSANRFKFTGIGVYPHWNQPGLHVEIGDEPDARRKYWWRDAVGNYRAITVYDLQEVFKVPVVVGI